MKITVISYSLTNQPKTIAEWKDNLCKEIQSFIENGSDVLLYPELFLMGLSDYFEGAFLKQLQSISAFVEKDLLPSLEKILKGHDIYLVLGSGPRFIGNQYFNTSSLWVNGKWHFQDKLHLTPWEVADFTPGQSVELIKFKKLKVATIICYDVEQPALALKLKEEGIHLLLVPSATSTKNGNQRVNRTASSRSIELGAAVVVVPLIGNSACELVDHNEGRQGFFLPAQQIVTMEQEVFSEYSAGKKDIVHYVVDEDFLLKLKEPDSETKPYLKKDNLDIKINSKA